MGGAQMHAALRSGLIAEVDRVRDLWGLDADLQPSRCVRCGLVLLACLLFASNSLWLVSLSAKAARLSQAHVSLGVCARSHARI